MAIAFKQLTGNGQLTTSAVVKYTATNKRTVITKATAFNADAATQTIDVWLVASGGSPGDTNKIIEAKGIDTNKTVILSELEGHVIEGGGTLQALASAGTAITLTVSGFEST